MDFNGSLYVIVYDSTQHNRCCREKQHENLGISSVPSFKSPERTSRIPRKRMQLLIPISVTFVLNDCTSTGTLFQKAKKEKRKNEATGYLPKFLRPRLTEKSKNGDNAVNLVTLWREKESWDLCSELLHLASNFFRNYITIDPRRYYIVLLLILIFETNFTRAGIKHKFLS